MVIQNNRILVVLNGRARAGKDYFASSVAANYNGHCAVISSVDEVKLAARHLGWDGVKDERGRHFLSDLKDMATREYDGPMNNMALRIDKICSEWHWPIIFVMIREPEEIVKFCKRFPDAITLLVRRDGLEEFSNHADSNVENYNYDIIVENNGTLEDLVDSSRSFLDLIRRRF